MQNIIVNKLIQNRNKLVDNISIILKIVFAYYTWYKNKIKVQM